MGWFGKRIGIKAPSLFLSILNRKLGYLGKKLNVVNTWTVKASQYCPISDTYVKKLLSLRFHTLPNGRKIQRDIFSAWLIKNVNGSLSKVNREKCLKEFDSFYKKYKTIEVKMRTSKKEHIASIGF